MDTTFCGNVGGDGGCTPDWESGQQSKKKARGPGQGSGLPGSFQLDWGPHCKLDQPGVEDKRPDLVQAHRGLCPTGKEAEPSVGHRESLRRRRPPAVPQEKSRHKGRGHGDRLSSRGDSR